MANNTQRDTFEGGLIPVDPTPAPAVAQHVSSLEDADAKAAKVEAPVVAAEEIATAVGEGADTDAIRTIIQQALAARDAEVSALRQELQAAKVGAGQAGDAQGAGGMPWMYWRKGPNWPDEASRGWIGVAPGGPTPAGARDTGAYNLYLKKGMQPITKYGYIEPPTNPEAIHSFLPMLKKGGAGEFPASQVIAFKWHITPPIKGLKFPQYEAVKGNVIHFECESCGHTLYFMPEERAKAGETYRAHLMVAHKYPFREAAEALRQSGFTARTRAGGETTYTPPTDAPVAAQSGG
jgi:hypothetical protein